MTTQLIPHNLNNETVCQRKGDGYIHATAMCKAAGKQFNDYRRLATTHAFLHALSLETGIPVSNLIITAKGRGDRVKQGTWIHPKAALHLAQWLSPAFAVQVVNWVYDWMNDRAGRNPLAHRPTRLPRWTPTRVEMREINSHASQILQTRFGAVRDALVAQIRADRLAGHDRPLSDYAIEPTTLLPANDPGLPKLDDGQALFMIRGVPVLIDFTDAEPAPHRDVIAIPVADGNGPARFTIEDTPPAPNWFDRCYLAKPTKPRNLVRPVVVVIGTIIKEGCNGKTSLDNSNCGDRRGRDDDGV